MGRQIWKTSHAAWGPSDSESGSCWVAPNGRHVWATVPSIDGPDQWWVLDIRDGRVIDKAPLQCYAAGSQPIPHPDGSHIGLSVGEGQDGAEVYWGCWKERPVVSRLDDRNRILIDIRPNGTQYLTTPHSNSTVMVHDFPSGLVRARLDGDAALPPDDWFDCQAGYVTNDLILVGSVENEIHILLGADALTIIAPVAYPEGATKQGISPSGHGTWMTSDHLSGRHQVWRLAQD
jgi:hypothetical protein